MHWVDHRGCVTKASQPGPPNYLPTPSHKSPTHPPTHPTRHRHKPMTKEEEEDNNNEEEMEEEEEETEEEMRKRHKSEVRVSASHAFVLWMK